MCVCVYMCVCICVCVYVCVTLTVPQKGSRKGYQSQLKGCIVLAFHPSHDIGTRSRCLPSTKEEQKKKKVNSCSK